MPCNVSTIDPEHKKKGGSDRRREELGEGKARGGGVDVTSAKRYHLWDNVKMGWGWWGGRGVGQGDITAQSSTSHGSAMTLENDHACRVL